VPHFQSDSPFGLESLVSVGSFGNVRLTDLGYGFAGAMNLLSVPKVLPPTVTNLAFAFTLAEKFNDPNISLWDTSNVTDLEGMFSAQPEKGPYPVPSAFNQPLDGWNVSKVTSTANMFQSCTAFNQPLASWNMGSVTETWAMFADAVSFNQPLAAWDTSRVMYMGYMFSNASAFNQPLGAWNVRQVKDMSGMLLGANVTTANYDSTLSGWSTQAVSRGVVLDADAKYSSAGSLGRQKLISTYGWVITDGGPA